MSRTYKDSPKSKGNRRGNRQRAISVRGIRRNPPDLRKLSRALIQLALDETRAQQDSSATQPSSAAPETDTADE